MYLAHFSLSAHPFRLTPDRDFLFMSEPHSRAKAYMDYTVWNRDGFVVITGEIGSGKTTLIQKLLSELDQNVLVAKVFQTQLDEVEFLQAILVEFGLNPFNAMKVELLDMLNSFLVEQFLQRKQIVLIVDDAHNLGAKALEEIRMLAGLETQKEKILHVILVGQPQLNEVLESPLTQQLLQRVKLRYHIRALSPLEVDMYIRFRLGVAGARDRALFAPDSISAIYKYTGGIPRLINTLCDTALTCAYADSLQIVTVEVVELAAHELQWPSFQDRIDKARLKATPVRPANAGADEIMREQSQLLRSISERIDDFGQSSRAIDSIAKRLDVIERHLRHLLGK